MPPPLKLTRYTYTYTCMYKNNIVHYAHQITPQQQADAPNHAVAPRLSALPFTGDTHWLHTLAPYTGSGAQPRSSAAPERRPPPFNTRQASLSTEAPLRLGAAHEPQRLRHCTGAIHWRNTLSTCEYYILARRNKLNQPLQRLHRRRTLAPAEPAPRASAFALGWEVAANRWGLFDQYN